MPKIAGREGVQQWGSFTVEDYLRLFLGDHLAVGDYFQYCTEITAMTYVNDYQTIAFKCE